VNPIAASALLTGVLLAGCAGNPGIANDPRVPAEVNERRILVTIADTGIDRLDLRGARSGVYRQSRVYSGTPPRVARALATVAADFRLKPVEGWPMRSLGVHCAVFEIEPGASIDTVIAGLDADERVESVQRMQHFKVQESGEHGSWDDPYLSLQRSLEDSGITRAHRLATGKGVRIAVIDTGIDVKHPDLRGQAIDVRDFISAGDNAPDRHGTAVAGVIASIAGNRRGIVGVAPGARLLALQACTQRSADGRGTCTSFSLARALDHAITGGSDVVNLSLGGPPDPLLERLLRKAIERDIVVVAAQGGDRNRRLFPASFAGVIAVASAGTAHEAARLAAPDQDVLTLVSPDGYDFFSGSSIAAAHVSGIVALLLERAPALRAPDIESLLARTSRAIGPKGADLRMQVSACDALAELTGATGCGADRRQARSADTSTGTDPLETH
jgi:subtilisin family serine protease